MYLAIKKKDSAASILFFLFNVFLVERGITKIPLKQIFRLLAPFQKNETAIRMGLSREVQNGALLNEKQGNEVYYRVTDQVLQGFQYWMETMNFDQQKLRLQMAEWDGIWSILILDPDLPKWENWGDLAQSLIGLGYGCKTPVLWISPYRMGERIAWVSDKYHLENKYYLFNSRMEQPQSPEHLTQVLWPIAELGEKYLQFLGAIAKAARALDVDNCSGADALPFLYRQGLDFFEIIQDDPRLPLRLLPPDWPGIKAAKLFHEMRKVLLPKAQSFVENIIGD